MWHLKSQPQSEDWTALLKAVLQGSLRPLGGLGLYLPKKPLLFMWFLGSRNFQISNSHATADQPFMFLTPLSLSDCVLSVQKIWSPGLMVNLEAVSVAAMTSPESRVWKPGWGLNESRCL